MKTVNLNLFLSFTLTLLYFDSLENSDFLKSCCLPELNLPARYTKQNGEKGNGHKYGDPRAANFRARPNERKFLAINLPHLFDHHHDLLSHLLQLTCTHLLGQDAGYDQSAEIHGC